MQKSSCLYHQLTNEKKKEKSLSNTNKQSKNKRTSKCLQRTFQRNKNEGYEEYGQEFNDYTIYPPASKRNSQRITLCTKEASTCDYNDENLRKKSFIGKSKHSKTLSSDFSSNDIKSSRTNKNYQQHVSFAPIKTKNCDDSFQQKIEVILKILCEEKIQSLENKITELNKKIQECENQTTKNHYEFVLLRDIMQKMKIQNLQLSSRVDCYEKLAKLQKHININWFTQLQFQKNEEQPQVKQQNQILKEVDTLNKEHQKIPDQSNFNQESTSSQKFENNQDSDKAQNQSFDNISKKISQIIGKQVNSLNHDFPNQKLKLNVKKMKPKKILHFENALKQQKLYQQKKAKQEQQLQRLFKKQSQVSLNDNFSLVISSEENLLQSVEIKKLKSQTKQKLTFQNEYSNNSSNQQLIENSFFGSMVKQGKTSLKQIQSQIQQFEDLLQNLKKKQKVFKNDKGKRNQVKSQQERVEQLLKILKRKLIQKQEQ